MRSGRFNQVFAIVLCTGVLAGALPAQEAPDMAVAFEPYWRSVTLQSQLYNPVEEPDRDPNAETTLQISGGVRILDDTALIGIEMTRRDAIVWDQDGVEIYSTVAGPSLSRTYQSIEDATRLAAVLGRGKDFWFNLGVPLDRELGYPSALSRVEWSLGALMADAFEVVDVPFEPNETRIEMIGGLEILVQEASVEEGRYSYRIQASYDPNLVSYLIGGSWHLWRDEVPAPAMLIKMDMLNAAGKSVWDVSSSGSSGSSSGTGARSSDGRMVATSSGSGQCSACGTVAMIRFTFALAPYERQATLTLENIPLPGF